MPSAVKINRDILEVLRYYRISVTELAGAMGIPRGVLSSRLNTSDRPAPEFLAAIMETIERLKR